MLKIFYCLFLSLFFFNLSVAKDINIQENINLSFVCELDKKIIKNSKVKLILIKNKLELVKYVKQNIYGNKIAIGMGAGSISNWIRDLPKYIK